MEAYIVHGAFVAGKLVQKLPCPRLPDGHTLISTASCDPLTLRIPACFKKIAFLTSWSSIVGLYTAISRRKRSDIPSPDSRIVCVGKQRLVVRGHLKRGHCVGMTK